MQLINFSKNIASFLCLIGLTTTVFGEPPTAGSILQNIDNGFYNHILPSTPGESTPPLNISNTVNGVSFSLNKIIFTGNTLLTSDQINIVLEPYLNKLIDFDRLQTLANSIENLYRQNEALARVVIPPQKILNSTLTLRIEEAVFGMVSIDGHFTKINPKQIINIIESSQNCCNLINLKKLERGTLLADDLPGITLTAILAQGSTPLTTDLIATVQDEASIYSTIQTDNSSPKSIGTNRLLGNLGINSPLGVGDLLSGILVYSDGSNYGNLSYTIPVGFQGLRFGINGSIMNYRLITSEFLGTGASGGSSTAGLEVSYPIIRSKSANTYFLINADYRQFNNSNNIQGVVSKYSVMNLSSGLFMNSLDTFGGSGANNFSLQLTTGNTNLIGSPNQVAVSESNDAQGSFTKAKYSASRNQSLSPNISLYSSVNGQTSSANLDTSEMFYLGGMNGIRAYPTNEGGGSQGHIATLELRRAVLEHSSLALFYDFGHLQINPNNNFSNSSPLNSYDMKGAGLSIKYKPIGNVDIKTIWAKRLGAIPNPTANGSYQNGTTGSTEFWFVASFSI